MNGANALRKWPSGRAAPVEARTSRVTETNAYVGQSRVKGKGVSGVLYRPMHPDAVPVALWPAKARHPRVAAPGWCHAACQPRRAASFPGQHRTRPARSATGGPVITPFQHKDDTIISTQNNNSVSRLGQWHFGSGPKAVAGDNVAPPAYDVAAPPYRLAQRLDPGPRVPRPARSMPSSMQAAHPDAPQALPAARAVACLPGALQQLADAAPVGIEPGRWDG